MSTSTSESCCVAGCSTSRPAPAAPCGSNDISPSPFTAAGFDADTHFMLMEISGDTLYFQAISRTGQTVDSGALRQRKKPKPPGTIGK